MKTSAALRITCEVVGMLEYQTTEKLSGMRLSVMSAEYRRQMEAPDVRNLSFEERFSMIVDAEWLARKNNCVRRCICPPKPSRLSIDPVGIEQGFRTG